jgi:glutamate racemase
VPLIEAGDTYSDEVIAAVREYAAPLKEPGCDTVILGCTHYPLISPMLQRLLGPRVTLVSSGAALARQVEHALSTRGLAAADPGGDLGEGMEEGDYRFLCTGDVDSFRELGTRFLQMPLGEVQRVQLAPLGVPT